MLARSLAPTSATATGSSFGRVATATPWYGRGPRSRFKADPRRATLRPAQRLGQRLAPAAQDGLAVGDEHALDRQVEQRAERLGERGERHAARQVAEPRLGTEPQPPTRRADDPVAGDQGAMLGEPEDRLARAPDRKRLDPRREVALGPRGRRPVALGQLVAAAAVKADRGQHGDRAAAPADVLVESAQEALSRRAAPAGRSARWRRRCRRARSRRLRPVGRAVGGGVRAPLRVRHRPAPQTGLDLLAATPSGRTLEARSDWRLVAHTATSRHSQPTPKHVTSIGVTYAVERCRPRPAQRPQGEPWKPPAQSKQPTNAEQAVAAPPTATRSRTPSSRSASS